MGASREIIGLLEARKGIMSTKFRDKTEPILLRAYEQTNEMLKAAQLKQSMNRKDLSTRSTLCAISLGLTVTAKRYWRTRAREDQDWVKQKHRLDKLHR
jgi:hypothetical protein